MRGRHAVEIILVRPATRAELHKACRAVPLAANADRTCLMTMWRAKSPRHALRSLRRELGRLLPIDVLTTHYPDASDHVLVNVALTPAVRSAIGQAAAAQGQEPHDFVARTFVAAVERDRQLRARQLTEQLQGLIADNAPEEVLACAARLLLNRQRSASPASHDADRHRLNRGDATP